MISISPQLTRLPTKLTGRWVQRCNHNRWDGNVSCREQFVILLLIHRQTDLMWAKSSASKDNTLQLSLDLLPTSKTEPHVQLHFSSGTSAFIQNATAELPEREYTPSIGTPETFDTGFILPFTRLEFVNPLDLSFACIAKTDVVVRRGHVWGLKPLLLEDLESPWDEILARGRNGKASRYARP